MNTKPGYSDEHINAYIDGELDNDERARLLYDEQNDYTLAQRINTARMLKEKIQLAYADVDQSDRADRTLRCTAFIHNHRSVAAALFAVIAVALISFYSTDRYDISAARQLIASTQAITASEIESQAGGHRKIIINVSRYQPESFDDTIRHIEALLQRSSDDGIDGIELVADRQGLKAFDTKSPHADKITALANRFDNLDVIACAKSLAMLAQEGDPVNLLASIMLSPSAAEQVAKRTAQGWHYIKI